MNRYADLDHGVRRPAEKEREQLAAQEFQKSGTRTTGAEMITSLGAGPTVRADLATQGCSVGSSAKSCAHAQLKKLDPTGEGRVQLHLVCSVGASGQFVDPVGARGSDRAERAEVVDERHRSLPPSSRAAVDRGERGEVVATVGQEVVYRDVVGRGRV